MYVVTIYVTGINRVIHVNLGTWSEPVLGHEFCSKVLNLTCLVSRFNFFFVLLCTCLDILSDKWIEGCENYEWTQCGTPAYVRIWLFVKEEKPYGTKEDTAKGLLPQLFKRHTVSKCSQCKNMLSFTTQEFHEVFLTDSIAFVQWLIFVNVMPVC